MSLSVSQIGDGDTVVGQHEFLQGLMAELVVPDGWNDEGGRFGGRDLFSVHDDAGDVGELGMGLRGARFGIVVAAEEIVRTRCGDALQEVGDRRELAPPSLLTAKRAFQFRASTLP
jgi:hypothetical protein